MLRVKLRALEGIFSDDVSIIQEILSCYNVNVVSTKFSFFNDKVTFTIEVENERKLNEILRDINIRVCYSCTIVSKKKI